jgi:hypothetical protein
LLERDALGGFELGCLPLRPSLFQRVKPIVELPPVSFRQVTGFSKDHQWKAAKAHLMASRPKIVNVLLLFYRYTAVTTYKIH